MLERLHEHINEELRTNTRTDTIFVIAGLVLNGIFLGTNSGLAAGAADSFGRGGANTSLIVMIITLILTILVNWITVVGLLTGRATRKTLLEGLVKMYQDSDVDQYYHTSLLTNYMRRYVMFIAIDTLMGGAALLIPLVVLVTT